MRAILSQVTNRDIAFFVWLTILVIGSLAWRRSRDALWPLMPSLFRSFFFSKITLFLLPMVAYVALLIVGAYRVGAWQLWMLKDTIYWFFGSAIVTFINLNSALEEDHFFRKTVLANVQFAALLAFVVNFYTFNLVAELLLLPSATFLVMLLAFAGTKPEYASVKKLLQAVNALIGLGLVVYVGLKVLSNPQSIATLHTAQDLLLPLVLTILLVPLIYAFVLYMAYENLFVRLTIFNRDRDKRLTRFIRWQIVKACRWRLSRIKRLSDDCAVHLGRAATRDEAMAAINDFNRAASREP